MPSKAVIFSEKERIEKKRLWDASKEHRPLQMLHDRVLIRRIPEPEGLIITPDIAKRRSLKAEVLAVGPGRVIGEQFYPTQVKRGDIVFVSPGVNVDYSDIIDIHEGTVIQEADILAVCG